MAGRKDNYPVDEELGRKILAADPTVRRGARANRRFMQRATRTLARRRCASSSTSARASPEPNLHQVAQEVALDARVVYADHDPIVLRHAQALLHGSAEGTTDYVHADVHDPDTVLGRAAESLDFGKPVALSLIALTHYLGDEAHDLLKRYVEALAPGSHLVVSQVTPDLNPEAVERAAGLFRHSGTPFFPRPLAEFSRFFDGLELLGPG